MKPRTGTDKKPLTKKEADELRDYSIKEYRRRYNGDPFFTCSTCPFIAWCEFAYDPYNTNGYCLATK
jgi:hypothetical protein